MTKTKKGRLWKWTKIVLIGLLTMAFGLVALLWAGSRLFDKQITALVARKIEQALPPHIDVDFSHLNVDLFAGTIELDSVTAVIGSSDSIDHHGSHSFGVETIRVTGISLLHLLTNRINVDKVALLRGHVNINNNLLNGTDSTRHSSTIPMTKGASKWKSISADEVELDSIDVAVTDDTVNTMKGLITLRLDDIEIPLSVENILASTTFSVRELDARRVGATLSGGMYTATIASLSRSRDKTLTIDSVMLTPAYPKFEFARKVGKQTDRINLSIPRIEIADFAVEKMKEKEFRATKVIIQNASLKAFRDKRVAFNKDHIVPLPYTSFSRVPFHIDIDTIELKTALIEYEEFPEQGDSSGTISFSDVYATFYRCNNRPAADTLGSIALDVQSVFMGNGLLKASFSLPYDTVKPRYTVRGNFSNFDLTTLNPAVRHLAKMSVKSGQLKQMDFDFAYNAFSSEGNLMMTYENLKIEALTKESDQNFFSELKTFLINTFIVRKNKDEEVKPEKRSGAIAFERDTKRSIFNYWWKSLLTGIKATYGIEDIMPTKPKND